MELPNLFDFATSELSQDAFICWLASWADPPLKETNPALHATATAFIDRLLEVSNSAKPLAYRSIKVEKQWKDIDVLLVVNGDTAIIIEDKTNTKDHSDQLRRYKEAVIKEYPTYRIAAVYFKTGDQCDFTDATQAGYGCFLRPDFLKILQSGKDLGVTNDIFVDFHHYLQRIEEAVQSFAAIPPGKWENTQWIGFFTVLQNRLDNAEWEVRGHGGGGSLPFRWHWRNDKFLLLNKAEGIRFKIEVTGELQQEAKWKDWNLTLMAASAAVGVNLVKPPRKLGKRMTVAILKGDCRQRNDQGLLDLPRTVETLKKAEELMDAALGSA